MKKGVLFFLFIGITGLAFSADFKMSIGAGGFFNKYFGMGGSGTVNLPLNMSVTTEAELDYGGFGGFVFFDAAYFVANVSYTSFNGGGSIDVTTKDNSGVILSSGGPNSSFGWSSLEIGLMGKYPFIFGRFTLFPLVGAFYEFVLAADAAGVSVSSPKDGNTLIFQGGIGTDYHFTESVFLRGEGLYLIRIPSQRDRDAYEGGSPNFGKGVRIKMSIGYTF